MRMFFHRTLCDLHVDDLGNCICCVLYIYYAYEERHNPAGSIHLK